MHHIKKSMIIKNGLVFLVEERGFVRKDIQVEEGKIIRIADQMSDECDYDAEGKFITPGLIEAHSHIGISEEGIGWEGDDTCESSSALVPEVLAIDAINPFDDSFKEALQGGVTVACTGPGSVNVVAGTFATIKLVGNVVDQMVINKNAAMKCAFGENPKKWLGLEGKAPYSRLGIGSLLRKCLTDAQNYKAKKENALKKDRHFDIDLGMEQMLLVLDRKMPLKAHVHRADDICTAIRIAKDYHVDLTLDHCTEGDLVADYIKSSGYPVIIGPTFGSRGKIELKNKKFETLKILNDAGVKVCITTDHNETPQGSLTLFAAMAVKAGLNEYDAMKAITINPAEVLKIDDRKGCIKEGMDADLVVWDKHPFDLQAKVVMLLVEGSTVIG